MINTLYLPELREMLAAHDTAELREFCTALHAGRTAEFMEGLTPDEAWEVLKAADHQTRAQIFVYLPEETQVAILESGDPKELSLLIADLPPDDRVDLIKKVDPVVVEEVLALVPTKERRDILRLRAYPEGTAGALMTTDVACLAETMTVREALEEIGRESHEFETIYYIYIVDDEMHLRGLVSARQLVTHIGKPNMKLSDLMTRDLVTVVATDDQETVAEKVADFNFLAIPVVDAEQRLVGIITHDDVIDVLRQEATEDVLRMGAVGAMAESYLSVPFATIWRKRAVWLACLFVAELFTFTALAHFEDAIAAVLVLSLFVPLCISTGGNSGSQAATLITRAVALGEIGHADWWKVMRHEIAMGLALGLTLGAIAFIRAFWTPQSVLDSAEEFREALEVRIPPGVELVIDDAKTELPVGSQLMKEGLLQTATVTISDPTAVKRVDEPDGSRIYHFPPHSEIRYSGVDRWRLAMVISQSVAAICLWGTLIGSMLPLIFDKLGFDPGYASSPFVATFVDVTGIILYFSIAQFWLL